MRAVGIILAGGNSDRMGDLTNKRAVAAMPIAGSFRSIDFALSNMSNSHVNKGVPIAVILQYGHGTGTGGWVRGRDYINPAIQPIFDKIADEAWREVTKL